MQKNRTLRKERKNPICDCSRSNQMPQTDLITDIIPYVRTIPGLQYHLIKVQCRLCEFAINSAPPGICMYSAHMIYFVFKSLAPFCNKYKMLFDS